MSLDRETAKGWQSRYSEVNKIILAEKRSKSVEHRLRAHDAFLQRLSDMGKRPESDWEEHLIWAKIQQTYLERNQ